MKYVPLLLLALSLVWVGAAQARDVKEMSQVIKKPIEIPGGTSARMSVMFPHTAHKGINCMHCHHEMGGDSRYVACTECHATPFGACSTSLISDQSLSSRSVISGRPMASATVSRPVSWPM